MKQFFHAQNIAVIITHIFKTGMCHFTAYVRVFQIIGNLVTELFVAGVDIKMRSRCKVLKEVVLVVGEHESFTAENVPDAKRDTVSDAASCRI